MNNAAKEPQQAANEPQQADKEQQPESNIEGVSSYEINVLLVDDQPMISEAVRRALASEKDINFHYCQNPTEAIKMANQIQPTVILQDLVMPEIDGLTMLKFFRANTITSQVPIIVLSTKEEPEIKSQAFSLGAYDYLVKLPDKIELIARIRHHSRSFINLKERDEAFQALQDSQKRLAEANKILQKLSSLDGLTGIPNRRRFDEVIEQEWQRATRQQTPLSIIMIDIDFFKLYNDSYGHQGGDDCLQQVAKTLDDSVARETDMVARYGGEEFVVVLPETDQKGAEAVGEKMRANIEGLKVAHELSKVNDYVSISVGVSSTIPKKGFKSESLLAAADQELYSAKEEGRNQVKSTFLALED